jgi:hypothetical protein
MRRIERDFSLDYQERKNELMNYSIQGGILCNYTAFVGFIRRENQANDSSVANDSSIEAMETDDVTSTASEVDLWDQDQINGIELLGTSNTEEHNTMGRPNMRRPAGHSRPAGHMGGVQSAGNNDGVVVANPPESPSRYQPYELINLASWDGRIKATDENIRQIENRTYTYWRHPEDPNYFDEYSFNWDRIKADLPIITDESSLLTMIIVAIMEVKFTEEEEQWRNYKKKTEKLNIISQNNWNAVVKYVESCISSEYRSIPL